MKKRFSSIQIGAIALFLLVLSTPLRACGPWIFGPGDISIYRIMPYWQEMEYTAQRSNFVTANCRLWAEQVGGDVTEQDVHAALYQTDYRDWKEFFAYHTTSCQPDRQTRLLHSVRTYFGISISLPDNAFVKQLLATNDSAALNYIHLCKLYEDIRKQQLDPWYYSCGWDDNTATLDSIAHLALQKVEAFSDSSVRRSTLNFPDRYLLLAVRAMNALRSDAECVRLWEGQGKLLTKSPLRDEMENYVAGSYLRLGQRDKAMEIYTRQGDIPSLVYVLRNAERVCEQIYDHNPNNAYFPSTLQKFLYDLENNDLSAAYGQYELYLDSAGRHRLLSLCSRAMADSRVKNKAMWHYTAAAIHDRYNRPQQALRCLEGAEKGCQDTFLCRSIRLFRCYLHARLDPVDDRYEQYLLGELRWIDTELQKEFVALDPNIRYGLQHFDELEYSSLNKFYTHDAMRKILLDKNGACARLAQHGRPVRALQLANMAENRLFAITHNEVMPLVRTRLGQFEYTHVWGGRDFFYYCEVNPDSLRKATYVDTLHHNNHDYSNFAFWIADTMSASRLVEYFERTTGTPRDEFDRFIADKGYRDTNYWYEIIGTHYLREGDYYNAVRYLHEVSPDFVNNQNIDFEYDPFSYDRQPLRYQWHPKLVYAERMLWLERQMRQPQDPDRLGLLMLTYSIGLRNAADLCWSYLSYGRTCDDYAFWDEYSEYYEPDWQSWFSPYDMLPNGHAWFNTRECRHLASVLADQWQRQAFQTLRSDEARAYAYHQLCFFDRIRRDYPNTPTARWIETHCDTKAQWAQPKGNTPR
jgi:hypothetical protein